MAHPVRDHWDLLLASAAAVAAGAVVALRPASPLRPLLGLPLVTVVPGYALVAALFPHRPTSWGPDGGRRPDEGRGAPLPPVERFVLSAGTSVALVALLGIALSAAGLGLRLRWILAALVGLTLAACLVAAWRRGRAPLQADESV